MPDQFLFPHLLTLLAEVMRGQQQLFSEALGISCSQSICTLLQGWAAHRLGSSLLRWRLAALEIGHTAEVGEKVATEMVVKRSSGLETRGEVRGTMVFSDAAQNLFEEGAAVCCSVALSGA